MAKAQGIIEWLGMFLGVSDSCGARRLSNEERRLVKHYRELSESDRIAMRYLLDAMRSISRF